MAEVEQPSVSVALVGPCAAGKSTLAPELKARGYKVFHIAQEHSFVSDLWHAIRQADWLVYLDVSLEQITNRRPQLGLNAVELEEQNRRLSDARKSCHLCIDTSDLTVEEVLQLVLDFLRSQ